MSTIHQWSSAVPGEVNNPQWVPREERPRLAAYARYDDMYWNDPRQYSLRVLEGEQPLYIPNARTVTETTAYYLLKGLSVGVENGNNESDQALQDFLKREAFYSRFNRAKLTGVTRGDWVMHLTADPRKPEGSRLSLNSVDPSMVFPIFDEHEPDRLVGCHIAMEYYVEGEDDKTFIRRLTYRYETAGNARRVSREEHIYTSEYGANGRELKKYRTILKLGLLDERINVLPIYWFKNRPWDGLTFGSSELRGMETILQTISQGSTDVSASLALEGLGVYATDGGRPVDEHGVESEWEISPGRVVEVPQGSYFRRVEGVNSITPAKDQIEYLEDRAFRSAGLSDVAMGTVDNKVAESGIALAIKFIPTLARIEDRDNEALDVLTQMFFDWKIWFEVFEQKPLQGDIIPAIGDKLPTDRTAKLNELNNMLDRRVISTRFYREEMVKLGYVFPDRIEKDIEDDLERAVAATASPNSESSETEGDESGNTLEEENSSNNRNRPNESSGTEA